MFSVQSSILRLLTGTQPLLLRNVLAGLVTGLVVAIDSISIAAVIYSGALVDYLPFGVSNVLLSSALTNLVLVLGSSFVTAATMPSPNGASILVPMAAAIASSLALPELEAARLPTVWIAIALGTVLTGAFLFLLGRFRLSYLIRFIPYPVVGGFLAGTGWLLTKGGTFIICGVLLSFAELHRFLDPLTLLRFLPGLALTVILLVTERLYKRFWVFPSLVLVAIGLAHVPLWWLGISLEEAIANGWFLQPFAPDQLQQLSYIPALQQVDWGAILQQSGNLISVTILVAILILLNITGLEIDFKQDTNLDRELRVNGFANVLVGLCGGTMGHISPGHTTLNRSAGATNRLAGIVVVLFCAVLLLFGGNILPHIPIFVVGSLTLYPGLNLLINWVYGGWAKLSRLDYGLVVAILVIIASFGFLAGVGVGIIIACFLFVVNYSHLNVAKYAQSGTEIESNVHRSAAAQKSLQDYREQIYALTLQGFLFFGTANTVLQQIRQRIANQALTTPRFLILDCRLVNGLDSSATLSLIKLKQLLQSLECNLVFTSLTSEMKQTLQKGGVIDASDPLCHVFPDFDRGLEWCEDEILKTLPLRRRKFLPLALQLSNLLLIDQDDVSRFMQYLERLETPEGQTLFCQGDASDGLYFIEHGQVDILLEFENGQSKRLYTLDVGTIFGEMELYEGSSRSASAVANKPCTLYHLSKAALQTMQTQDPDLSNAFHQFLVRSLSDRLKQSTRELQSLLR
jgi:sulfate permease, SulP family